MIQGFFFSFSFVKNKWLCESTSPSTLLRNNDMHVLRIPRATAVWLMTIEEKKKNYESNSAAICM